MDNEVRNIEWYFEDHEVHDSSIVLGLCDKMIEFIEKDVLDINRKIELLISFLKYVTRKKTNYIRIIKYRTKILNTIDFMINKLHSEIIKYKSYMSDIAFIVIDWNYTDIIDIICKYNKHLSYEIFKMRYNKYVIGKNNILRVIMQYHPEMIKVNELNHYGVYSRNVILLEYLLSKTRYISEDIFDYLIQNNPIVKYQGEISIKLLDLAILKDVELNTSVLEKACLYLNYDFIMYLLDNGIKPNDKCMENIIKSRGNIYYTHYYHRHNMNNLKLSVIDILINHNCKFTYQHLIMCLDNNLEINDFEKYNIQLTEEYFERCATNGVWSPNIFKQTKYIPSSRILEIECSRKFKININNVRRLVSMGVKPTQKALENACSIKSNYHIVNYLIECGVKATPKCMTNIINTYNLYYTDVINNFLGNMDNLVNENINLKRKLEKYEPNTNKIEEQLNDININENINNNNINVDNNKEEKEEKEEEEEKEEKTVKIIKRIITRESLKKNIININKIDYIEPNTNIKIPSRLSKLLEINKNTTFLMCRRKMLEYLNNNKLYRKNVNLIKLDKKMLKCMKEKKQKYSQYILLEDLDNMVKIMMTINN